MLEPLLIQNNGAASPSRGSLHIIPNCHVNKVLFEKIKPADSAHYGAHKPKRIATGVEAVVTLFPESDLKADTRGADGDAKKLNRPKPTGTR